MVSGKALTASPPPSTRNAGHGIIPGNAARLLQTHALIMLVFYDTGRNLFWPTYF